MNIYKHFIFAQGGLAVEVGSGGNPHWRSDLLIDKFIADAAERPGGVQLPVIDRPLLVADACHLPLQSESVDLLITRNLLEHIVDPEIFFGEMTRVSHRGYITTPSALAEKLFGWSKHIWFVSISDGELNLRPKDRAIYDASLSRIFHTLHKRDRSFQRFYRKNKDLFIVEYYWEGDIEYQVEGYPDNVSEIKTTRAQFDLDRLRAFLKECDGKMSLRRRAEYMLRRLISRSSIEGVLDLLNVLACPVCKGHLSPVKGSFRLICEDCARSYPIFGEVPILVEEAANRP